jgi:lipid A disaccharide synthetase
MNKEVVKELIQQELTVQNIQKELELLLSNQLRINDLKMIIQL